MDAIKPLSELTIRDNFLFVAVMQQGDNCKHFLEMLLETPIERINIQYEKSIIYNPEYKGIRMDVYASDENRTHYNVELQIRWGELPRRSRYYHSQMDMELLGAGEDYEVLPDSYVIFICDFDPFGQGRYCYRFENQCLEVPDLKLGDGSRSIFLNTRGRNTEEVSQELVRFLKFIHEHQANETKDYGDEYVSRLQRSIRQVKQSRELGGRYMSWGLTLRDEYRRGKADGIAEGIAEGIAQGKVCAILDVLEELDGVPQKLRERILEERDEEVLQDMLKAAAKSDSIGQFMETMQRISTANDKNICHLP